jgi:hypothetical protein
MMRKNITEEEFNASFTPATIRRPSFDVGTKVFISDKKHPAGGETGTITTAPREVNGIIKGVWAEVEIDGWAGHECGIQPHQMRELRAT